MAATEVWAQVICDAGPLIHLDELGCLDLLRDFEAVLVPDQVWEEVERHRASALILEGVPLQRRSVEISADPEFHALVRALSLDRGEQAALSLMKSYPDSVLLTDDSAARLAAKALGFRSHGSLGVLLRAIRQKRRTKGEVLRILRRLPSTSTLHIRSSLLEDIIRQVESL